eukprot:PRCOL_00002323-RA
MPGIDIWMPFIIIGGALTVQATILKYNYIAWHGKPRNAPGTKYDRILEIRDKRVLEKQKQQAAAAAAGGSFAAAGAS